MTCYTVATSRLSATISDERCPEKVECGVLVMMDSVVCCQAQGGSEFDDEMEGISLIALYAILQPNAIAW